MTPPTVDYARPSVADRVRWTRPLIGAIRASPLVLAATLAGLVALAGRGVVSRHLLCCEHPQLALGAGAFVATAGSLAWLMGAARTRGGRRWAAIGCAILSAGVGVGTLLLVAILKA